jgi:hypothetical protein
MQCHAPMHAGFFFFLNFRLASFKLRSFFGIVFFRFVTVDAAGHVIFLLLHYYFFMKSNGLLIQQRLTNRPELATLVNNINK